MVDLSCGRGAVMDADGEVGQPRPKRSSKLKQGRVRVEGRKAMNGN